MESNQENFGVVWLHADSIKIGSVNALLLFNLGWSLVNEKGVDRKHTQRGISLWKEASLLLMRGVRKQHGIYIKRISTMTQKEAEMWFKVAKILCYDINTVWSVQCHI